MPRSSFDSLTWHRLISLSLITPLSTFWFCSRMTTLDAKLLSLLTSPFSTWNEHVSKNWTLFWFLNLKCCYLLTFHKRKMPLMILFSKSESLIFFPRQIKLRCFVLILQTLLRNFTKKGQTWIFPSNQEIKLAEEFSREILEVKFNLTVKTEICLLFSFSIWNLNIFSKNGQKYMENATKEFLLKV